VLVLTSHSSPLPPVVPIRMAAKSTSSESLTFMKFGRVFAILRSWAPISGNSSSKITCALEKSLLTLTIGAQHVALASQGPDIMATNPLGDSYRHRVQEDVRTVEAIALAGPALKAAVGGLLEILKAADVSLILSARLDGKFKVNPSELLRIEKMSRSWKRNFVGWTITSLWTQLPLKISANFSRI